MIDQQDKENNLFGNEMFDQESNQFERKLSSVSSFKPAGTASQRSSKPIGKLFIGRGTSKDSLQSLSYFLELFGTLTNQSRHSVILSDIIINCAFDTLNAVGLKSDIS